MLFHSGSWPEHRKEIRKLTFRALDKELLIEEVDTNPLPWSGWYLKWHQWLIWLGLWVFSASLACSYHLFDFSIHAWPKDTFSCLSEGRLHSHVWWMYFLFHLSVKGFWYDDSIASEDESTLHWELISYTVGRRRLCWNCIPFGWPTLEDHGLKDVQCLIHLCLGSYLLQQPVWDW